MKRFLYLVLLFTIVSTIFNSCKSIKSSDFQLNSSPIEPKLTNLSTKFDENNLLSRYSISTSSGFATSNNRTSAGTGIAFQDKRVEDFKIVCDRMTKEIFCLSGKSQGIINYKIVTASTKNTGIGFSLLSGLTLGIPNIFGMPFGRVRTEIEIEAEILDCNGSLIRTYRGYGKKKIFAAAYYGYRGGGEPGFNYAASRKSNIEAIKISLENIKSQLEKESGFVKEELINCNK